MEGVICIGDFGSGDDKQREVSKLMKKLIKKHNIIFILGLGDNIYPTGVESIKDNKFIEQFEEPYKNLPKHIKFYNVLGNHDYYGNTKAQISYTNISEKWCLPHNFYCFNKKINNTSVEFYAIDTNFNKMSAKEKTIQKKWIMDSLSKSRANWHIVYGHHPWKSSGTHGKFVDGELDAFYSKLVELKKVDIMIAGHDHDQQHIHIPEHPEIIISGTGSTTRKTPVMIRSFTKDLKFYSENLGCCVLLFTKESIEILFYNNKNEIEYSYKIIKKK